MASDSNDPLQPELEAVEQTMETAIEQVCGTPPAHKIDTGELIRVEETLAIAAEAAKEAVTLRRKIRTRTAEHEARNAVDNRDAGRGTRDAHESRDAGRGTRDAQERK